MKLKNIIFTEGLKMSHSFINGKKIVSKYQGESDKLDDILKLVSNLPVWLNGPQLDVLTAFLKLHDAFEPDSLYLTLYCSGIHENELILSHLTRALVRIISITWVPVGVGFRQLFE